MNKKYYYLFGILEVKKKAIRHKCIKCMHYDYFFENELKICRRCKV